MQERSKPLIGILAKPLPDGDMWSYMHIVDNIRYVLVKQGALVVGILPTDQTLEFKKDEELDDTQLSKIEKQDLGEILDTLDGVVLQGGLNNNQYEIEVAKYCVEKRNSNYGNLFRI